MTAVATGQDLVSLAQSLAPEIRGFSDDAENMRQCPPKAVELLHKHRLFDMILPRKYGGLEESIPTMVRVLEELSIADASIGWVVGIGNGTSILAAHVPEHVAEQFFRSPAVSGGAQAPHGRATPVDGGFRISGRWPFASGCTHCTVLVAGCLVMDGDAPRMLPGGFPDFRTAIFPIEDVELIDTWHVSGLRGTGSRDMMVKDVFVPEERMVALGLGQGTRTIDGPAFRYPPLGFLALTISPIPLGIARRAIDELVALAEGKTPMGIGSKLRERQFTQIEIARAEAILRSARAWMYEVMDEIWDKVVRDAEVTPRDRALVRMSCAHAALESLRAVDIAYTLGGGSSIYESSALQRCMRDVHAATQHVMLAPPNYEPAGRAMLGLDVPPMV
ncbi:MAG TPA: acyl-CoA dehydrogenase family protein [Dehalococcoidia bacterium]|jgi:alkylation response protein AidB-like acyl-CoA dehydrogenase